MVDNFENILGHHNEYCILYIAEFLYFRLTNWKAAPTQQKMKRKVCKILVTFVHLHSHHDKHLLSNIGLNLLTLKDLQAQSIPRSERCVEVDLTKEQ